MNLFKSMSEFFRRLDPFDCAIYVTLILLIIERPEVQSLVLVSALPIIIRPLFQNAWYWLLIFLVYVVVTWQPWYNPANHFYLQAYWCLSISLSLFTASPRESLAKAARWIIGLVFLFSVVWKLRTPEFLDGRFFEYVILADSRFIPVAVLLGLDSETLMQNRELLNQFKLAGNLSSSMGLVTAPLVPGVSLFLTWWTLLVELVLAVFFLIPERWMRDLWRHGLLLAFIYTTYLLAPVAGFGWVLIALGMSHIKISEKSWCLTALYLAGFVLVFLGRNPGLHGVIGRLGY